MKHIFSIISAASAVIAALIHLTLEGNDRPRIDPDAASPIPPLTPKQVEQLAYVGGTDEEIADRFLVDPLFIARQFEKELRVSRALHHLVLRTCQFDLAKKGNGPILTWLGKNHLSQSNNPTAADEPLPEIEQD